jgi:uncharacterized RDD family membrane protein YckC
VRSRVLSPIRTLERMAAQVVTADLVERTIENPMTLEATMQVLESPSVHSALTRQTRNFLDEIADRVRSRAERLDDRLSRNADATPSPYGGIATRGAALALDIAVAQFAVVLIAGVIALVGSLVGGIRPAWVAGLAAGAGSALATGAYLVFFWTVAGQTPAMRLMRLRVVDDEGRLLSVRRSLVRFVGLILAILPLFAGFLPVLRDKRRRGLHDFMARTTVRREGAE